MTIKQSTKDQIRVKIFKALSDETRLDIIRKLLKNNKKMSCGEIGEQLDVNKSTLSYHFKNLYEANLISTQKMGQNKLVSLNVNVFNEFLPNFLKTL